MPELTQAEQANLRIFRGVAAEARVALRVFEADDSAGFRVVRGYIESDGAGVRVRNMCIPVRRAYLKNDPVNMGRIIKMLRAAGPDPIQERLDRFEANYVPIQQELDSASILNDRSVTHAEMFEAWIDAVVFHEIPAKRQPFLAMAEELGKAVEGIALHLAERMAVRLVELDDVVAEFLGEPAKHPEDSEDDS
jgi:hypothetical protein